MSHESLEHIHRVEDVLGRVTRRNGQRAVSLPLPLSALTDEEWVPEQEQHDRELTSAVRQRAFHLLLDYVFADGPHPGCVMRRLFALARGFRPDLIAHMNGTDLGKMFDEGRAAQSWRVNKMFDGYLKARGAHSGKLPFQKSDEARRRYADAQRGNSNRKGKSGRRKTASKPRKK